VEADTPADRRQEERESHSQDGTRERRGHAR